MSAEYNWAHLAEAVEPKTDSKRLSWDEVRTNFRKVAWDVYKSNDNSDTLWELRADEDGKNYLYAMYEAAPIKTSEEPQTEMQVKASSDWSAICDRDRKNITLSFKGFPLKRFASEEYKFSSEEAEGFAAFLQAKTAEPEFVRQVITGLPLSTTGVLSELKPNSEE